MLPVEQGQGQIWRNSQLLCNAEYEISAPLRVTDTVQVQRITLLLAKDDHTLFLDVYGLVLVRADGNSLLIPRPFYRETHLECYVESSP